MNKMNIETYKKAINEAALEYYTLSQNGANVKNIKNKLFENLYQYFSNRYKYAKFFNAENDLEIIEVGKFAELQNHCLEKWAPGQADFFTYFSSRFYNRVKNKFHSKQYKIDSITDHIEDTLSYDQDGSEMSEDHLYYMEDRSQRSSDYDVYSIIKSVFDELNESTLADIKKYENSPKFCYSVRFFTEYATKVIAELGYKKSAEYIPPKTLKLIDKDFAAFYLDTAEPDNFKDIARAELRPLSEFSLSEADSNVKCGYDLRSVVYKKYVLNVKGKTVSDAAISQNKNKFKQRLSLVCDKEEI